MDMHGYSKSSLARKLGLKEGFRIFLKNQPEHYFELFTDLPTAIAIVKIPAPDTLDFIHLFCTSAACLEQAKSLKSLLKKNGMLWVSWPKGGSKIDSEINRESVREFMLKHVGLVDIKVASLDEDWSALKFVFRAKDR